MKNIKHHNIRPYLNFSTAGASLSFVIPLLVLRFKECGLNMAEITQLQALFALCLALAQIPTGRFADRYGRKLSMQIGSALVFLGEVVYMQGSSYYGFLFGELLLAFGMSFISGADVALLSDSLSSQLGAFAKVRAEALFRQQATSALFAASSGFIAAAFGIKATFLLAATGSALMFFSACQLREVTIPKSQAAETKSCTFWRKVLNEVWGNRYVLWLVLLSATIFAFNQPTLWFYQPYFQEVGISLKVTGLLFCGLNLFAALWTKVSNRVQANYGGVQVLFALIGLQAIAYVLLATILHPFAASLFLGHQIVRSQLLVTFSDLLNAEIDSETKATVNSVASFVNCSLYILVLIPMGKLADVYGIQGSFLFAACGGPLIGAIFLKTYPRRSKDNS